MGILEMWPSTVPPIESCSDLTTRMRDAILHAVGACGQRTGTTITCSHNKPATQSTAGAAQHTATQHSTDLQTRQIQSNHRGREAEKLLARLLLTLRIFSRLALSTVITSPLRLYTTPSAASYAGISPVAIPTAV